MVTQPLLRLLGIVSINIVINSKNSKKTDISLVKTIPVYIFQDRNLTPLEGIVKFLRIRKKLSYHKISKLLNRNVRDIYKIFKNSLKKSSKIKISLNQPVKIPLKIFSNKKLHALEALTVYLHEKLHLKFSQIAVLLNRDDRTIWTVYQRARKKYVK